MGSSFALTLARLESMVQKLNIASLNNKEQIRGFHVNWLKT